MSSSSVRLPGGFLMSSTCCPPVRAAPGSPRHPRGAGGGPCSQAGSTGRLCAECGAGSQRCGACECSCGTEQCVRGDHSPTQRCLRGGECWWGGHRQQHKGGPCTGACHCAVRGTMQGVCVGGCGWVRVCLVCVRVCTVHVCVRVWLFRMSLCM